MATRRKASVRKATKVVRRIKAKPAARAKVKAKPKAMKKVAKRIVKKVVRRVAKKAARAVVRKVKMPRLKAAKAPVRRKAVRALENLHVRNLLTEVAGEKALKVVGEMTTPMSDEDISKCAGVKISDIRAVLNKLHAAGVAAYDRTRNDEGWYTYTWRLTMDNAFRMIEERQASDKRSVDRTHAEGAVDHYVCPICTTKTGVKLGFDQAVEAGFRCPDCSEMLHYVEKKR